MKCNHLLCMLCLLVFLPMLASAQSGQIDIGRVSQMSNMPSPYVMRNWKDVALRYDSLAFNLNASGQFLPLVHLKSSGVNYASLQPILLDSYVGVSSAGTEAEAINIIPAVVGATLVGVNKSNQFGQDWVSKVKDFYNKANGQNVYLNGYAASSGSDWWYDLMPNVFFYQLYSQYPNTQDFNAQFTTVADRWLDAVYAMGGSALPWHTPQMNYRAFNLSTRTPVASGVSEPEGAGAIAWLLYNAYQKTGNKKYMEGAQMAIGFLSSLNTNPAYEIQLPYGTLVAAKINAERGTRYDVQKMINWSFDQSAQRNWGTIVGSWGNGFTGSTDVSGLVGEIDNPSTGYAFAMNGYQQAAALVPLIKYDKRYARTVAKWTLHLANASRLFYAAYLPASHQDSYTWDSAHDQGAVVAYEALKQKGLNDSLLFATGDAMRTGWGQTNLGLYGSSHVGYLGAIVSTTNVDGILLLDVNKTDFFGQNAFPSHVAYNPYPSDQSVTIPLGSNVYDVYDAISETIIKTSATGNVNFTIKSDQVLMLVYLPAGASPLAAGGKLVLGNKIVDYHYGYNFAGKLLIQSMASADSLVAYNQVVHIYSSVRQAKGPKIFKWTVNGGPATITADSTYTWTAPSVTGAYKVLLNVSDDISSVKDSLSFAVVAHLPVPPVISSITQDSLFYMAGSKAKIVCHANTLDLSPLKYAWTVPAGNVVSKTDSVLTWIVPPSEGLYDVICEIKNADSLSVVAHHYVLVKVTTRMINSPVAYFPFDGDVKDYSGNGHDATRVGAQQVSDERGEAGMAYRFSRGSDIIDVPNDPSLNFPNHIALSFWLKLDDVSTESYVLSHGSYQQRWKISVIPGRKIRWTIKTASGTFDLDSSFPLELNLFYHFAAAYTGYSMEWYVNGALDTYLPCSGAMSAATMDIAIGRQTPASLSYGLQGTLDEVRIYDHALGPNEMTLLKTLWNGVTALQEPTSDGIEVFPNPSSGQFNVTGIHQAVTSVSFLDVTGKRVQAEFSSDSAGNLVVLRSGANAGLFILRVETAMRVYYKRMLL